VPRFQEKGGRIKEDALDSWHALSITSGVPFPESVDIRTDWADNITTSSLTHFSAGLLSSKVPILLQGTYDGRPGLPALFLSSPGSFLG